MMPFKLFVPIANCIKRCTLILLLIPCFSVASGQSDSFNDSISILTDNRPPNMVTQQLRLANIRFTKKTDRRVDIGLVADDYHYFLLKITATDTAKQQQYVSIDNTSLDTVQVYRMVAGKPAALLYEGGNNMPFNTARNYVWHTAPLDMDTAPAYYLVAIKAAYKNLNVRYDIIERDALQKKYTSYQRYVYFYMGIASMIAVVMLIAIVLFKQAVFGAYLGYTVCSGGWILTHYGCVFPMLYPNHPMINEFIKPVTSLGASLFLMIVLLQVFRSSLRSVQWLQWVLRVAVFWVAAIASSMFLLALPHLNGVVHTTLIAAWQVTLGCSIGIIVLTPLYFVRTGYTAKIFAAAVLTICVMTIVQQVANLGYIKSFFINEHGITGASLLEISIMAFGLFYNFYQEKKAKEKQVVELEKERTETLKKLIAVQDNERKRIAADLHDNLGPLLAALKINFRRIMHSKDSLQQSLVDKTENIIDDSIAEIRNVAHNLMPKGLSANGLISTLSEYFEGIEQLYDKKLLFQHRIEASLTHELQTNLYRIICELVLNAARHSQAATIGIDIQTTPTRITVRIYDDGQGFIRKLNGQANTLGLQSAESRVLYMKGNFNLQSQNGKGTLIDIQIPL